MRMVRLLVVLALLTLVSTVSAQDGATVTTAFNEAQPNTLDPHAAAVTDEFLVLRNVCESLVNYDPVTLEPVPALAESWSVSEDGTVYTFTLREGVTFSDGSAVDAEAVKYSLDRLARRETGTSYTAGLILNTVVGWSDVRPPAPPAVGEGTPTPQPVDAADSISGVEVIDERTVQITLVRPLSAFLNRLTLPGGSIIPVGAGEVEGFAQAPICTGPYVVSEFTPNQQVVLTANENYWGGAPDVQRVVIRVIPEQSVQVLEYEAGALDIVAVPPSDLGRLRGDGTFGVQLVEIPTLSLLNLRVNLQDEVLGDVRVRRALALAVDRQTIIDTVLQGQGVPADGLYPPGLTAFDDAFDPFPYDPEAARALLAEAGYPDGVEITLRTGQIETERRVLTAIQQTAAPAGFDIIVSATERSVYDQDRTACTMQAGTVGWGLDYPDPENVAQIALAGTSATRINCGYGLYENVERAQELFDQAVATPLGAERDALWREFEQLTISEQVVVIPIYHGLSTYLVNPRLDGIPVDNLGSRRFNLIELGE